MTVLRDIDEAALVLACRMFVEGAKTPAIRQAVNEELARLGHHPAISREQVYQLLTFGRERGYFTFTPPERLALQTRVANSFEFAQNCVHVANSRALDNVAATAATLLVKLICDLGNQHETVHVGLGGGFTTRLVAYHLAVQLRAEDHLPKLVLYALSTGFDPKGPHMAPVTFFGFFEGIASPIDYVGLFTSPVVKTEQYGETLDELEECYRAAREDLHLVITSLGSASHPHGDFKSFMGQGRMGQGKSGKRVTKGESAGLKVLKKAGWIGDILFRPYSALGPITQDTGIRAVTLLELEQLREMASTKNKHVVVVAGPCTLCTKTRSDAVRPLFEEPKLKLWSHFVMDMVTATELLGG